MVRDQKILSVIWDLMSVMTSVWVSTITLFSDCLFCVNVGRFLMFVALMMGILIRLSPIVVVFNAFPLQSKVSLLHEQGSFFGSQTLWWLHTGLNSSFTFGCSLKRKANSWPVYEYSCRIQTLCLIHDCLRLLFWLLSFELFTDAVNPADFKLTVWPHLL